MKGSLFCGLRNRTTEGGRPGKPRNTKENRHMEGFSTASKLPAVRLSSASANRQLSQPKIFPSPGAARPRGFFCGRRGGRGAWPPAPLPACALWRAFAGPCRRGGTAGCAAPCFCAKPCRGASLFRQAPLFFDARERYKLPCPVGKSKKLSLQVSSEGRKERQFCDCQKIQTKKQGPVSRALSAAGPETGPV